MSLISLVVPLFNEEETIEIFWKEIQRTLEPLDETFEIVFVDDGSRDDSWACLSRLLAPSDQFRIRQVRLSRNFGKEAALTAGLHESTGDAVVPIDIDLQDPIELIPEMIDKWREGYDVVLAQRASRDEDGLLKRSTASGFYKLHRIIANVAIPKDVGDFRLISREVVAAINQLPENQRFMKGIFAWVGYRTAKIPFHRNERSNGVSKFNFWKLWNFAIEGITSFSTVPLRIFLYLGIVISIFSFGYGVFTILKTLIFGIDLPGYASMLCIILFFGGLNLVALGVIGEYLGRIYVEAKRRPIYLVSERVER